MNNSEEEKLNRIELIIVEKLSDKQLEEVTRLQKLAFTNVDDQEIKEDFYHPKSAQVLAYEQGHLIGWAGIHETEQEFEGRRIKIGGYGICTHPDYQGKGVGTKVSAKAMEYLKNSGTEIGFLSVDSIDHPSVGLHKKNGFVMLPRKFSWSNAKGELKEDHNGMIAPVNSQELFEYVLNGKDVLYVGNGYW